MGVLGWVGGAAVKVVAFCWEEFVVWWGSSRKWGVFRELWGVFFVVFCGFFCYGL